MSHTKYSRFNFEATENNVTVCKDEHEKGQHCEYVDLSSYEVVEILNTMRASLLKYECAIRTSRDNPITKNQFALFDLID